MLKRVVCFILFVVLGGNSFSEYRMWKDRKGNCIEAELVCENAGKIVIRDQKGKTYRFAPEKLSEADQKYLRTAFPPKIDIVFSKNQDRRKLDGYYAEVDMDCSLAIKKISRMPYDGKLKVVLMVIGKDNRRKDYIMLDKKEASFDFISSKTFLLKGNSFRMHEYDGYYYSDMGTEYVGYLAVVLDKEGKVVEVKSSRKGFSSGCKLLMEIGKGSHFTKNLESKDGARSYY